MNTNISLWLRVRTFLSEKSRKSPNSLPACSNKNSVCLYLLPDLHHSFPEILGFNPVTVFTHLRLNNVFHHKHLLQNCPIYHLQNKSVEGFSYIWVTNNSSIFPALLEQTIIFFILMNGTSVTKFRQDEI